MKKTYRRLRTDFWTHPKTAGLSPLARDVFLQAVCACMAGVMERSARSIAKRSGARTEDVRAALVELQDRGLVRFWEDHEIVWAVGAFDEQAIGKNAAQHARRIISELPAEVRAEVEPKLRTKVRGEVGAVLRAKVPATATATVSVPDTEGLPRSVARDLEKNAILQRCDISAPGHVSRDAPPVKYAYERVDAGKATCAEIFAVLDSWDKNPRGVAFGDLFSGAKWADQRRRFLRTHEGGASTREPDRVDPLAEAYADGASPEEIDEMTKAFTEDLRH